MSAKGNMEGQATITGFKIAGFAATAVLAIVVGIFFIVDTVEEESAREALRAAKPTTDIRFSKEWTLYSGMKTDWQKIDYGYCVKVVGDGALIVTMGDRSTAEYDPLFAPNLPKGIIDPLQFEVKNNGPVRFRIFYAPVKRADGTRRDCALFNPQIEIKEYYEALRRYTETLAKP